MRLPIPLLALALAAAACGGDGGREAEGGEGPTSTAAAETTTTTRSSTTTSSTCPAPDEEPAAAVDLDGDGAEERWRHVGSGASVDILGLFRLDGCAEVPVTVEGVPAEFAVGGSVLLLQGVRCEGRTLVHLGATSEDGETYATLDLLYELRGGELVRVGDRTGTLDARDPALRDYSSFDC